MNIDDIKQYVLANKKQIAIGFIAGFVLRSFLR